VYGGERRYRDSRILSPLEEIVGVDVV